MSTQEAIVAVLVAAVFANLALSVGLIVGPRIRTRRDAADSAAGRPVGTLAVGPGRPIHNGSGSSHTPRLVPVLGAGSVEPAVATDPLTGFELAGAWSRWLAEEGTRVTRYGRPATIVIVELAGIDRVADRLGSEAADRLIPPIATTMRHHARASDNLARLGRARFGALLIETDEIRAINYVERVRAACDVWLESGAVALRLSIGWAQIGANQSAEVAIQTAERRLYAERARLRAEADADLEAEADVRASIMEPTRP